MLSMPPVYFTSEDELACHEQSSGACGAVVVYVDDGDPSETQAVVNGSLPAGGVS